MLDTSSFKRVSQFEEVEKVVHFNLKEGTRMTRYRVEAVRHADGKYSTIGQRELEVIVQPAEVADSKQLPAQHETIWVDAHLPWTHRDSADAAIAQLLSLLES